MGQKENNPTSRTMRYKKIEQTSRKVLLTSIMLLCMLPEAIAQETADTMATNQKKLGLFKRVLNYLNKPYGYFDDRYVKESQTKLIVTLTGEVQQTGVRINDAKKFETDLKISNSTLTNIRLQERVFRKVGVYVTFSGIRVGWGTEIGRKSAERNTSIYLAKTTPYYGLTARYFNIKEKVTANTHATVYYTGNDYENETITGDTYMETNYPANLRELQLDGYYAFNRHRFAYTAVYGSNVQQRRSAGSWMLGMKYLYGQVKFDSREVTFPIYVGGISRFTTHQLSVGGGYSYNLVVMNRDESGPHLKGLRNLTFNATIMPMITVLNPLTTYYDEKLIEWFGYETDHRTRHTHPALNYTATAGMVMSIDRLSFNVNAHYDNFHFNAGSQKENLNKLGKEHAEQQNRMKGRFYNWSVEAELQIKF